MGSRLLRRTITCVRPEMPAWADAFGNTQGTVREEVTFEAVYAPPTTSPGIADGVLRQTTITKPTLYVIGRPDLRSGDPIVLADDSGWQVDGDPAEWSSPRTGREWPLVVELRRTEG